MKFMTSSLDKLVKNLLDEDFKYLVEEFGSKNLELLKQKDKKVLILTNIRTVLKLLRKKNYLPENIFIALQKMEKSVMIVKYQTVT